MNDPLFKMGHPGVRERRDNRLEGSWEGFLEGLFILEAVRIPQVRLLSYSCYRGSRCVQFLFELFISPVQMVYA